MTDKPDVKNWVQAACRLKWGVLWERMGEEARASAFARVDEQARAFLRAAAADGFRLVRVPDAQNPNGSTSERYAVALGFNTCRAATLASAVEVGE